MVITQTATFTPEEVAIVAKMKGYSEMVPNWPGEPEIQNPQSKEDFVKDVYEKMVKADVKNVFLEYARLQRQEAEKVENETISSTIEASITSSIIL